MVLYVLLALDVAGYASGGLTPDAATIFALILAIVAIVSTATRRPLP